MLRQLIQPTRTTPHCTTRSTATIAGNPAWHALSACQPRQIHGATYSQIVAGLQAGEVLVARVAVYVAGMMYPQQKEIAYWITNCDSYTALIHGTDARNREIMGYYAIRTEQLLSLLFV